MNIVIPFFALLFGIAVGGESLSAQNQLMTVPPSARTYIYRDQLGYIESLDEVDALHYACLAFIERNLAEATWMIYIQTTHLEGRRLDPFSHSFKEKCEKAAITNKQYFLFGDPILPKKNDQRRVEYRVYVDSTGTPLNLELYLVTRNLDGSPKKPVSLIISWPYS